MKKVECLHCSHEFVCIPDKDSLGWCCCCPVCECSFDVDYEKLIDTDRAKEILEYGLVIGDCIASLEHEADDRILFIQEWTSRSEMVIFAEKLIDEWANKDCRQGCFSGFVIQRLHDEQKRYEREKKLLEGN